MLFTPVCLMNSMKPTMQLQQQLVSAAYGSGVKCCSPHTASLQAHP
jgi:hypothetical protein